MLPDDLICVVFECLAEIDLPSTRSLGWIKITHVNRRWRALALSLSALWGQALCTLPRAFDILLARSRLAPLYLDIPPGLEKYTSMHSLKLLLPRAASLVDRGSFDGWPSALAGQELSLLRTLHIAPSNLTPPIIIGPSLGMPPLVAPSLVRVYIREYLFPITCPSLRFLTLRNAATTIHGLLDFLQNTPLLKELDVTMSLYSSEEAPILATPVSLPHLTHLVIEDSHLHTKKLWNNIVVPFEAAVCVRIDTGHGLGWEQDTQAIDVLLDALASHAFRPSYDSCTVLRASPDDLHIILHSSPHPSQSRFTFEMPYTPWTDWDRLYVVLRITTRSAPHIRTLAAQPSTPYIRGLTSLVHVTTVVILKEDNQRWHEQFADHDIANRRTVLNDLLSTDGETDNAAFPKLKTLVANNMLSSVLFTIANWRFHHSAPIKSLKLCGNLSFEDHGDFMADADALKDIADVVPEITDERDITVEDEERGSWKSKAMAVGMVAASLAGLAIAST